MIYKPDVYGAQKAELKRIVLCLGRSDTSRFCRQQRSGQQVSYLIKMSMMLTTVLTRSCAHDVIKSPFEKKSHVTSCERTTKALIL